ncbi:MAG TPA: response regulator [Candidatus Omnitrophota bacterium]|nr:response regulator [Candidatus Omnitrophota bacterium]
MARILVADDNQDIAMLVIDRLSIEGHQLEWVASGDAAFEKLKKESYDLAILDILMPGRDGVSLCYIIKHSENVKKIPVLLMSAYSQDAEDLKRSNADAFLSKPFVLSQLVSTVNRLLQL